MILTYVLIGVVVLFATYQAYATQKERVRAIDRERELLAAVLAKNAGEYLSAIDALRKTPNDKLAEMRLENELAQAAVRLERGTGGFPVN
jgi:hypothetical protein